MKELIFTLFMIRLFATDVLAQSKEDSLAVRQAALDYIESQHRPNPDQFARSSHPLLVKRTFWKDQKTNKQFVMESTQERMLLVAESYNAKGDKFPPKPQKDVIILDMMDNTASVKLIADEWIDYMHVLKLNGKWQIVNVLWQFKNAKLHNE